MTTTALACLAAAITRLAQHVTHQLDAEAADMCDTARPDQGATMPNASNSDARKRLAEAQALHRDAAVRLDEQRMMTAEAEARANAEAIEYERMVTQRNEQEARAERAEDEWRGWRDEANALRTDLTKAEAQRDELRAVVHTFADELDAGASLRWTSDVAKELRARMGGGST